MAKAKPDPLAKGNQRFLLFVWAVSAISIPIIASILR